MSKLIILRGNSGSGKTTIAKTLRNNFPNGYIMTIGQDEIRREILNVKDTPDNLTVSVIKNLALFGREHYPVVIIEGILNRGIYGNMLEELALFFEQTDCYYFDLTFSDTVARHQTRKHLTTFTTCDMARWWLADDYLGFADETLFTAEMTKKTIVDMIMARLSEK